MTTFTIKSREHGEQIFSVNDQGGYVRLERSHSNDPRGMQICYGGGFRGNTITADADTLEKVARAWWRQYLKFERNA